MLLTKPTDSRAFGHVGTDGFAFVPIQCRLSHKAPLGLSNGSEGMRAFTFLRLSNPMVPFGDVAEEKPSMVI